jgi:hypothetical protein
MKKIYSLFAFVLISTALFAQNTSNLIVFSEDGLKFYLILNGIRQNETAVTNIKVDKLNQPYYAAKIIFEDKTQPVLEKKYLPVVDAEGSASLEVTYKIKKNNKNVNVLRFFSQVPIAQAAPPSPAVQEIHYNTVPMPDIFTSITINVNVNAGGVNVNVNVNDPYYNRTTTTTSYTHTSSSSSSGNVNTNTNNNTASSGCGNAYAMSNSNFAAAKQTITKQSFDDTKLTTAKQVIKSNCLSSAQIKELMLLFSFEATRLDLAKFAHERCVDKNNYFLLNDAFEFESSVEELNNSIK